MDSRKQKNIKIKLIEKLNLFKIGFLTVVSTLERNVNTLSIKEKLNLFKIGFSVVVENLTKLVYTSTVKANVAYDIVERTVLKEGARFIGIVKVKSLGMVELIESKFGKIHFNFQHFVMTTGMAAIVFALAFTMMGIGRSNVSAAVLENIEVEAYNDEVIQLNYGDDSLIISEVKDILSNTSANVNAAKTIQLNDGSEGYEIGNYIVELTKEPVTELVESEIHVSIQSKKTYQREDFAKVAIQEGKSEISLDDGAIHEYKFDVEYVDVEAPKIQLSKKKITIDDTDSFSAKKYVDIVTDNYDGIIDDFKVSGSLDKKNSKRWEPGTYTITYSATDSSGNVGKAKLKVKVVKTKDKVVETKDEVTTTKNTSSATSNANVPASAYGSTIASAALGQIGVYQDCTMLVTNSLRAVGIYHHGWPASYLSLGTIVPASQAQPGDIVYYANGGAGVAHVAVYIGGGQAVHGGFNGNQTVIASVYVGSGPVFIRVG